MSNASHVPPRKRTAESQKHISRHLSEQSGSPSPITVDDVAVSPPASGLPWGHQARCFGNAQQPIITADIRVKIVAALATLRGKRGAPFTFVASGDTPSLSANGNPTDHAEEVPQQQSSAQSQPAPSSLRLSWLLRPLVAGSQAPASVGKYQSASTVSMPSYLSSMTLGQAIKDPIESGILTTADSVALFDHFMLHMNAKWEYLLDPHFDTHQDVRRRSALLFATILFCSSKFASCINGRLVLTTDAFLQSRLCIVARNLAIGSFARGDRSIETMQAFYLLACWKERDDDVSYLHSGYAFRVLHDLDLEQTIENRRQAARLRTWLALFRQDKQQSMFFIRRASFSLGGGEGLGSIGELSTWLAMPYALPLDFVACCNADLRQIQSKMRVMAQKASTTMLPLLLDLMDTELQRWKTRWQNHLEGEGRHQPKDDRSLDRRLLQPGRPHIDMLVGLWEHSVRLNVASAVLRQALMASVVPAHGPTENPSFSSLRLDSPAMLDVLLEDVPGLSSSVEGAFGILQHLLLIPTDDLRRSPDSVLLLGPNACLFLLLLLCLPCHGVLGASFQKTAVNLIEDVARHVGQSIQSPQDTVVLHVSYLDSLVRLLHPTSSQHPPHMDDSRTASTLNPPRSHLDADMMHYNESELEAAHALAGGSGAFDGAVNANDTMFNLLNQNEQNLGVQSLANLLDTEFFQEMPPMGGFADFETY